MAGRELCCWSLRDVMVSYRMVSYGMIWYDMVWYMPGSIPCGLVRIHGSAAPKMHRVYHDISYRLRAKVAI